MKYPKKYRIFKQKIHSNDFTQVNLLDTYNTLISIQETQLDRKRLPIIINYLDCVGNGCEIVTLNMYTSPEFKYQAKNLQKRTKETRKHT